MSFPIVEVKNLGKKYKIGESQSYLALRDKLAHPIRSFFNSQKDDDFWALTDVNFSVERGETVGIIGKNGAGKSTLLKILSQITPPTTGIVTLRGRVGSLLEVGTGFHPELTGRENIYLNGAILGMRKKEIKDKMDEIIEFSGVEKFIDTPVKRYSSGMYVRLAFAVAAHLEPDILIVDEVLAVGDIEFQKKCLGKMQDITRKDGRTVFFVSHNIEAIKSLCKKSILLDGGKVIKYGLTEDVANYYLADNEKKIDNAEYYPVELNNIVKDSKVNLLSVRLLNKEGLVCSSFGSINDIFVSIDYEIKEDINGFLVDFYISNEQNAVIFISSDNDRNQFTGKKRISGKYNSICKIPGNLLNVGKYSVTVGGRVPNIKQYFIVRDALMLHIQSNGGPTGIESRESIIYPDLDWQTKLIN
ncbi:MAG: hypothetical protein A2493_01825 [Candidatus Magasanikbacteria bacterium RIFOXYC12_FULL_33_11]|uniref:ABC transporter domain-containing protein n=1 Tax=Candidatus Magasanikbacteria bacterium RIFOXYC12_FULL_33_11 TaxID=1798701 RepID=A0A1F6NM43_9BACT|nr:MAG: hypothetical protein A2493_01825 [Candidatus Magasanikbacteria bacterium RIFOXYC12_FULL_33_11]